MVLYLRDFASVSVMRMLSALILLAAGTPTGLAAGMSPLQQGVVTGTVSEQGEKHAQPDAQVAM